MPRSCRKRWKRTRGTGSVAWRRVSSRSSQSSKRRFAEKEDSSRLEDAGELLQRAFVSEGVMDDAVGPDQVDGAVSQGDLEDRSSAVG